MQPILASAELLDTKKAKRLEINQRPKTFKPLGRTSFIRTKLRRIFKCRILKNGRSISKFETTKADPHSLSSFVEQFKLEAFWYKKSDSGEKLHYSIDRSIIKVIIRDLLFEEENEGGAGKNGEGGGSNNNDLLPDDMAMKAFKLAKNEER